MNHPHSFSLRRWLATGTLASVLSMCALAWHGRRRHGSSVSLINAPSHWIHGERALRANETSWRFTLPGAIIHHASSLFWAAFYEVSLNGRRRRHIGSDDALSASTTTVAAINAVGLTTLAWLVDTRIVPDGLSPGFQRRSSKGGMLLIYGAFALGLFLGTRYAGDSPSRKD